MSTEQYHTCPRCKGYKTDTTPNKLCPECQVAWDGIAKPLYLCICQYGHSRSVALARVLHSFKQEAIAAGVGTSGAWLETLCHHADRILILETTFLNYIPKLHQWKVMPFHVGPDRWVNPYNPELNAMLRDMVLRDLKLKELK